MLKYGCDNCDHCALCCKGWDIELTKEDIRSLASLGYKLDHFLEIKESPIMKTKGKERNCIFLDRENLCVLEKRHGHEAKPHTCKLYPKIRTERLAEKDYFFFEYGGKTFTRDVFSSLLDPLKHEDASRLYERLLAGLEKVKKQKPRYVDRFNFDGKRNGSFLSARSAKRKTRMLVYSRVGEDDSLEFLQLKPRKGFDPGKFVTHLQKGLEENRERTLNPNLPEMLLAFLYATKKGQPRDEKAMSDFFFRWNDKRF
jgi:Fe-S-cluster containining protein